mmetsp:Transcript_17566/g.36482  ORF Transcript_17566/g.36482 Transcript_17566/m.36482 type:complete len:96 (-) Transcript_17566:1502-1789(-)
MGFREREPRKNSSWVGARRRNILRLSGFRGGFTMSQMEIRRDCSAFDASNGGGSNTGSRAKMENEFPFCLLFPKKYLATVVSGYWAPNICIAAKI